MADVDIDAFLADVQRDDGKATSSGVAAAAAAAAAPDGAVAPVVTDAAAAAAVRELIPACAANQQGIFKPEIFGYDIARMQERPWARPGANTADYFNYGFDEDTWRLYCALQLHGQESLRAQADAMLQRVLTERPQLFALAGAAAPGATAGGAAAAAGAPGVAGAAPSYIPPSPAAAAAMAAHLQDASAVAGPMAGVQPGMMGGPFMHHHAMAMGMMGGPMMGPMGVPMGPMGVPMGAAAPRPGVSYFKTRLCKSWRQMNFCADGANCRFAHGEEELRPPVPTGPGGAALGGPQGLAGTADGTAGAVQPGVSVPDQQQQQQQQGVLSGTGAEFKHPRSE